ncbi:hypothetical protein GCM10009802_52900 [Streptomyces synnematoformans]|uniref:Uncharacterized protein n=1 Tax=Streptomyces synnematoformans TaxID=415721 RepID=A0ABN2ZHA9_9ACTN
MVISPMRGRDVRAGGARATKGSRAPGSIYPTGTECRRVAGVGPVTTCRNRAPGTGRCRYGPRGRPAAARYAGGVPSVQSAVPSGSAAQARTSASRSAATIAV